MSLYYNNENYQLQEIDDNLYHTWTETNNPKALYYVIAPIKPSENAVWKDGEWIIPEPVIPSSVSARQIRLWLITHGISLASVETAILAIEDPVTRDKTLVEWEYAPYVERSHPLLITLAASFGLTSEQVDQAFMQASIL